VRESQHPNSTLTCLEGKLLPRTEGGARGEEVKEEAGEGMDDGT